MPSYTRMKRIFLEGLLWLFLLQYGLMGLSLEPGFLDFDNLPDTNFTCVGKVIGGYYADLETNCQMFHVCTIGQADEPMDIRFLCLNGTVFDQETRVCERIDEVDCSKSEQFYSLNLELYGNSGPILDETPEVPQETEPPSILIKSTTPTSTTTTTTHRPTTKRPSSQYYTTIRPSTATTLVSSPQVVAGHHFPVNTPDIRFNPEEINISLNPGAPPDIRTKHFQPHHSFSDASKLLVGDSADNDEEQSVRVQKPERPRVGSSSTTPKSVYAIDTIDSDKISLNSDDNFGFSDEEFHGTEIPRQQQFLIQTNSFRHSQSFPPNLNHNSNQYHHPQFHSTTVKQPVNFQQDSSHTTLRTLYLHSPKPPEVHQHHHYTHHPRTEKTPQRVQIPIPLLPTLPPLTFSSPAPFTLQRHIENKRYTKDHQAPPRIIISASASVSDASGRRLNYSLGTIGAAHILESPPSSYDDYKDSDVGLDPFYHDVPKLKQKRRSKREAPEEKQINPFEIIKNEKEAVEVLKFLFTWYQSHQATATVPSVTSPVSADLIRKINYELAPGTEDSTLKTDSSEVHFTKAREPSSTESLKPGYDKSELFKKNSRFSIVGGYRNENLKHSHEKEGKASEKDDSNIEISKMEQEVDNDSTDEKEADDKIDYKVDTTELREKIDDDAVSIPKDAKESAFNPDDYVDDNYEGVVYKEGTKIDTNPVDNANSKEENASNSEKGNRFVVDPAAVSELYKYFNVMNRLTTEAPTATIKPTDDQDLDDEHKSPNINPHNLKEYTEINVMSEVNEDDNISESSTVTTTTTTTTTTKTPPRQIARRRGKGRQRSSEEVNRKLNIPKPEANINRGARNYISTEKNSFWSSPSRRDRSRARTRFTSPYSSTSTTPASTSTAATETIPTEETHTASLSTSTEVAKLNELDTTSKDLIETTSIFPEITEVTPDDSQRGQNKIVNKTDSSQIVNQEIKLHDYSELEVADNKDKATKTDVIEEYSEHKELDGTQEEVNNNVLFRDDTETKSTTAETIQDKTIKNDDITNTLTIEKATDYISIEKKNEDNLEPVSELNAPLSTTDDPSYLVKLLKYYAETSTMTVLDEPVTTELPEASYDPLTENQVTSTPSYVPPSHQRGRDSHTSTELRRNRSRNKYRHSLRVSTTDLPTLRDVYENIMTHESILNTDSEKIVEAINVTSNEEVGEHTKSKADLLEKLSTIEQNLSDKLNVDSTTEPAMADTTITTPLISFEERESFATTLSTITEPYTTDSQELTKMFDISTEAIVPKEVEISQDYDSFYADLFVVPELTEKSPEREHNQEITSKLDYTTSESTTPLTKTDDSDVDTTIDISQFKSTMSTVVVEDATVSIKSTDEPETTTLLPDVEIQKSISLPISVLETSYDVPYEINNAQDINALASAEKDDNTDEKSSTILDIPSTVPTTAAMDETTSTRTLYDDAKYNSPELEDNAVPETIVVSTETTTSRYVEEHLKNLQETTIPQVQQNATEIIFLKNTKSAAVETPGMVHPSHLLQVIVETTTPEATPTISTTAASVQYQTRKTRPPFKRPNNSNQRKPFGRHRFSTELFTKKPPKSAREFQYKQNLLTSEISKENITDAPLYRSATPTRSELKKVLLHTTPLSSNHNRPPTKVGKHYVFNCFGKEKNRFYADPRDCRLFHYCTQGYSKNQLLDLKYVCDQKTFFDEDKLICTKVKPARCL